MLLESVTLRYFRVTRVVRYDDIDQYRSGVSACGYSIGTPLIGLSIAFVRLKRNETRSFIHEHVRILVITNVRIYILKALSAAKVIAIRSTYT